MPADNKQARLQAIKALISELDDSEAEQFRPKPPHVEEPAEDVPEANEGALPEGEVSMEALEELLAKLG